MLIIVSLFSNSRHTLEVFMAYYFKHLLETFKEVWYQSLPSVYKTYTPKLQKQNDLELMYLKKVLLSHLGNTSALESIKSKAPSAIPKKAVLDFLKNTLNISQSTCDLLDQEDYLDMTIAFIDRAYLLCPAFTFEDIYQALRNVWVMATLQIYLDRPVLLTDSVFAYSMLYPLTDNYMDDDSIDISHKKDFNARFLDKITSNSGTPKNANEECIFSMIDLISLEFPRENYPLIYESLSAILDGQNKSLDQQSMGSLYDLDLLSITFYKGGTSVLCDAYLVNGHLSESETLFAFGYGVVLQLADDLQDISEDLKHNHCTITNTQSRYDYLDALFLKLMAFTQGFITNYVPTTTKKQLALKELLVISIELLFFGGACSAKNSFSSNFTRTYFKTSCFSYKKFCQFQKTLGKRID